jgi:hypothetical protein
MSFPRLKNIDVKNGVFLQEKVDQVMVSEDIVIEGCSSISQDLEVPSCFYELNMTCQLPAGTLSTHTENSIDNVPATLEKHKEAGEISVQSVGPRT